MSRCRPDPSAVAATPPPPGARGRAPAAAPIRPCLMHRAPRSSSRHPAGEVPEVAAADAGVQARLHLVVDLAGPGWGSGTSREPGVVAGDGRPQLDVAVPILHREDQ